jgi:NAD(P)-dependent dehydrogenase (short-subunit alcohol dehydrogenase family)
MKHLIILCIIGLNSLVSFAQPVVPNELPADTTKPYALVAGGSKGIGYGIALALAKRGYNLILIARHMDTLQAAKNKLESAYPIHVEVLAFDLAYENSAAEIGKWCTERNIQLKMLCNVAGFGGSRDYLTLPLDSLHYMIRLESRMALSLILLPLPEKRPSLFLPLPMAGFSLSRLRIYTIQISGYLFSYSLRYRWKIKYQCKLPA